MEDCILIVDDEKDICVLLESLLRNQNYHVVYANSLKEAYLKLRHVKPRFIFLDLNLPDGSGFDAITRIRASHPQAKIVIISAYDSPRERNTARQLGAQHFIEKPFNKHIIQSSLENLKLQAL